VQQVLAAVESSAAQDSRWSVVENRAEQVAPNN
jgi:hypothetical protein